MSAFRSRALLAALLLTLAAASHRPARADEPAKPAAETSLSRVPADAAFYSAGLRWREQIELFRNSRAYKALRALPTVKKAYDDAMAKAKDGGALDGYEKFAKSDMGKDVITILTEAASQETFVFGGSGWSDFLRLYMTANLDSTVGMYGALASGGNASTGQQRALLRALDRNKGKIKVPDLVVGFHLATPAKAAKLLDKLSKIAVGFTAGIKELEDRVETKKVGESNFLTVQLDGGQIPWDKVPFADLEEKKGEFDGLVDHLKKTKLTAALGVGGSYLLLSIGEGTKDLEEFLGKGKKLAAADDLKVVRDLGGRKFTALGYVSKEFVGSAGNVAGQYRDIARGLKDVLKGADLKEERKKAIAADLDDLEVNLEKAAKVEFGSSVGYQYLTDYGYEGFSHDRTDYPGLGKIKFALDKHFGGQPIFAAAFGYAADGAAYRETVRFAKKAYAHAEAIYLDAAGADAADEYKKVTKVVFPILAKMEKTTTEVLLPALSQTGLGVVIDGKWKSKRWLTSGPESDKEMPMAELGLLIGVSDGKKFGQGLRELREAYNELIDKAADFPNPPPPGSKIPSPETGGGLLWWPIPGGVLDAQFQPTAGAGKAAAVLALSKEHARRLMKPTPLTFRAKELEVKGEVLGASVLDWIGLIELVSPWVEQTVEQSAKDFGADAKKGKQWAREAQAALTIFRAFKGATSSTTKAEVGVVHRRVIAIKDIEALPDPID